MKLPHHNRIFDGFYESIIGPQKKMDSIMAQTGMADRRSEWFVPKSGSQSFRIFVGLLFLPYTGMVISFTVIGSMLASDIHWDRVGAIATIYFLGLGIAAHALDALGSKTVKPWGSFFARRQLWLLAFSCLFAAYAIAAYYICFFVPWLAVVAVLEGFFVFAYNLEWFDGKFHTDGWFSFSWGFLPVTAGYLIQTNTISPAVLFFAFAMALFSRVEIKASRPYKALKKRGEAIDENEKLVCGRYESILKSISLGVILLGAGFLVFRLSIS